MGTDKVTFAGDRAGGRTIAHDRNIVNRFIVTKQTSNHQ